VSAHWLVTGGDGFIGSRFVARLRDAGERATIASRGARGDDSVAVDLLDDASIDSLVRDVRPTHLALFAWTTEHGTFWDDPANERWRAASLRLVDDFLANGGTTVVGVGSCAEYAWTGAVLDETAAIEPATRYGRAKAALSTAVAERCERTGARCAWGRIFFAYGPGEGAAKLATALTRAAEAGTAFAAAEPDRRLDFIYVDDIADAFAALARTGTGAYNVGSGCGTSVREMAAIAGVPIAEAAARAVAPQPDVVGDNARLRSLGWAPQTGIDAGLRAIRTATVTR